jgi:hypothetical protein
MVLFCVVFTSGLRCDRVQYISGFSHLYDKFLICLETVKIRKWTMISDSRAPGLCLHPAVSPQVNFIVTVAPRLTSDGPDVSYSVV